MFAYVSCEPMTGFTYKRKLALARIKTKKKYKYILDIPFFGLFVWLFSRFSWYFFFFRWFFVKGLVVCTQNNICCLSKCSSCIQVVFRIQIMLSNRARKPYICIEMHNHQLQSDFCITNKKPNQRKNLHIFFRRQK